MRLKGMLMKTNLKRTLLDSRQFVGLLLLAFCAVSLVIAGTALTRMSQPAHESIAARWEAEMASMDKFGFVWPPLESFVLPLLVATLLLAAVNFWLSLSRRTKTS
jgi:hypothetical protein